MKIIEKFLGKNYQAFLKKFTIVFSGSSFSQIITLATYPLLTRIFSVEQFGLFTNFFSLMVVFSVIQSLKLQHAIVTEKSESKTFYLLIICFILPIFNSVFLFLLYKMNFPLFRNIVDSNLLVPVIISGLLMVFYDVGYNFLAKYGLFKNLVVIKIIQNSSIVISQLFYGFSLNKNFYIPFDNGLIAGFIIGQSLSLCVLFFVIYKYLSQNIKIKINYRIDKFLKILSDQKKFIYFSMPAEFINSLAYYLVVYFVTANFGIFYAGLYGLSQRIIMGPLNLISVSMLDIFKNYSAEEMKKTNSIKKSYNLMIKILIPISLAFFVGILIFKNYSELIFGQEWRDVGRIVLILSPFYLAKFLSNPLSYTFFLLKRQEIDFSWQIGLLLGICLIFSLSSNFYSTLYIFSIFTSIYYLFNLILSYKLSKK